MKKIVSFMVFFCLFGGTASAAETMSVGKWTKQASKLVELIEFSNKRDVCDEASFEDLSNRYIIARGSDGKVCRIYDLSFPTLSSLFTKVPSTELRVKKPTLSDYRSFLKGETNEASARNFLEEGLSSKSLKKSWYSKLQFKKESLRNLRTHRDGVIESFRFSDLVSFKKRIGFSNKEKALMKKLLLGYGAEASKADVFVNNPRGFLDNIKFEYDSLKKAYQVFLDFDFLPIKGPITTVDHSLQYRGWLQGQIRSLVLFGINRLMIPVKRSVTGRIVNIVINDAFRFIDMTYNFQRLQLEKVLRMALDGSTRSTMSKKELKDSLYLLYVQDSTAIQTIIMSAIQTGSASIDNMYPYGKASSVSALQARTAFSDKSFSNMHYELKCDLQALTYYFAHCEDQSEIYSLISETSIFVWNFGNPKVINLESPWEVLLKRSVSYLLSGAVKVNFLSFPDWISNQVSSALTTYAFSGVMDEAFILSELYERSLNGESLSSFEQNSYDQIMSKSIIPFLPRSRKSMEKTIAKHRKILTSK